VKKILSIPEVAKRTDSTQKAIRQRIARGQFPHQRWGKRIVVSEEDLERFLAALPGVSVESAITKIEAAAR
jgi:hypothetical protein